MDIGDILSSQGKADSAIYHYERVSQINPKDARAIFLKGNILEKQGNWYQAKDMYRQAAKLEHNNPLGQFYLGRALLQSNELEDAEKSFQMAVILKPNLLEARKCLAWVYERLGKPEEALKEYNLLIKLKKDNTFIEEGGTNLSGGQLQRISIARAILGNPSILLLDEATSALDAESEKSVQMGLNQAMKNRTVLIIAHRLSTTQEADNILFLEDGRIIESGTHDQLMVKGGKYRDLCEKQFIRDIKD